METLIITFWRFRRRTPVESHLKDWILDDSSAPSALVEAAKQLDREHIIIDFLMQVLTWQTAASTRLSINSPGEVIDTRDLDALAKIIAVLAKSW